VAAFSGSQLLGNRRVALADFFAGDPAGRGGVRVAVKDLDGDSRADLVTGAGDGAGARTAGYTGRTLAPGPTPPAAFALDPFAAVPGGVYVG